MGVWGPNLYDDDRTADVRDTFQKYIEEGVSPPLIKQRLLDECAEEIMDPEDGPLIRLAIADQLRMLDSLGSADRDEAINYLLQGGDLENWKGKPSDLFDMRKKELARLAQLFQSPLSPKRDTSSRRDRSFFQWKVGQVYALPLCSQAAHDLGLVGEYLLFYIFGEGPKLKGDAIPSVWIKLTKGGKLPQDEDEFNCLDYVQIACTAMEDRFRPFLNEEALPLEYRQEYYPDPWGFLPEYSMTISETRNSRPPKSLVLLGDFPNITPPAYNYRRYRSAHGSVWKYFESFVLLRYRIHNLRQGSIYHGIEDSSSDRY